MHFVNCSQRQSGNLRRQQPPIIVNTKQFQYLKLLLYLLNIIIILFSWINVVNVRLRKWIYFAFQGVSFVFKKIVDTRKIVCALSILLRNKNTSSDTLSQGPEEMCLSLEHQNPSKTSEQMGYFDRVTVLLHILQTANQETEGSQDRLTV